MACKNPYISVLEGHEKDANLPDFSQDRVAGFGDYNLFAIAFCLEDPLYDLDGNLVVELDEVPIFAGNCGGDIFPLGWNTMAPEFDDYVNL